MKYITRSNEWFKEGTEAFLIEDYDDGNYPCGLYEGTYVVGSCNPEGYDKFWYEKGYVDGDEVQMREVCGHAEFQRIE